MQSEEMIPASEFCIQHHIELSFIRSLKESGLIETILVEEELFLPSAQLSQLEKLVRFHFELDINLEGIETITHLLQRMERMQEEMARLTNRLRLYEG